MPRLLRAIDINAINTGTVEIAGDLITTGATNANNDGSDGGDVTIDTVDGDLTVSGVITTSGGDSTFGGTGDAGSAGDITLTATDAGAVGAEIRLDTADFNAIAGLGTNPAPAQVQIPRRSVCLVTAVMSPSRQRSTDQRACCSNVPGDASRQPDRYRSRSRPCQLPVRWCCR